MNTSNTKPKLQFDIKELSLTEVSDFFHEHDNDYYERLSDRIDIEEYSAKLLENSIQFTLSDDSNLIGLSPCYFNNIEDKVAYISSLTIKNGFRGQKLGTEMIKHISEYAKENTFKEVMVKIHYDNTISKNFYNKNGFTDFKEDKENDFRLLKLEV